MPSEKQIDTVARMLDPDAFALEKTMLLMKGEMFGHHGERVRAARGKAEELLTAAEQAEPFEERILTDEECAMLDAAWERHKAAKPKFLPTEDGEFNGNEQAEPATDVEPYLWLHPWNGSTSKHRSGIAVDCPKDGPQPIPLYTHPTPSEARLKEALHQIDALDPEGHTAGFSVDALRGLIERMGAIARTALKETSK